MVETVIWLVNLIVVAREIMRDKRRYSFILCRVGEYRVDWDDIVMSALYLDNSLLGNDLRQLSAGKFVSQDAVEVHITFLAGIFRGTRALVQGEGLDPSIISNDRWTSRILSDYSLESIYSNPAALLGLILGRSRGLGATDDRDRVFALLAILGEISAAHGRNTSRLAVDYGKTTTSVYTEAMACVFAETGSLSTLWEAQDPSEKKVSDLPSWVSDFWQRYATPLTSIHASLDAETNDPQPRSVSEKFCASAKVTMGFCILRLENVMRGRRTFLLSDGRLGLEGQCVQPGDLVCLIADGGQTAFLLRRVRDDQEEMRLISEAFVERNMFGEFVEAGADQGEAWKEICIV